MCAGFTFVYVFLINVTVHIVVQLFPIKLITAMTSNYLQCIWINAKSLVPLEFKDIHVPNLVGRLNTKAFVSISAFEET